MKNKPRAIVFDIGANVGPHTLPLAKIVSTPSRKVYAFEPTQWAFEKLQRNIFQLAIIKRESAASIRTIK